MRRPFLTACVLTALAAPAPAWADWRITPMAGVTMRGRTGYFDPDDAAARQNLVIGAAVARTWRRLAIEAEAAAVPGLLGGGDDGGIVTSSRIVTLTGNLIAPLPRIGRLHPYAVGGAGAMHVSAKDAAGVFPVSEWQATFNAGAGVTVPASRRISIGADARYFKSRRGDGAGSSFGFSNTFVDFWRLSGRLTVAIGK